MYFMYLSLWKCVVFICFFCFSRVIDVERLEQQYEAMHIIRWVLVALLQIHNFKYITIRTYFVNTV